ncbi:MAG TPA: YihY/virulence factor BrkB family protein [Candidatus Angelobacter sp.]|jgi:membrane protein|nr:YihY/virulence factor BrkB family protein [Candidatus Angelobacter sp.]
MHFTRLRRAFWQGFLHGQFSNAKAAAYSSILTLFPALLVITSVLEASHTTEGFLRQISAAVGWVLPPGPNSIALTFFQTKQHHANRILYSASTVTLLAASGVMISWMEGFRRAYNQPNTWGFWKERAIALYLVFLTLIPFAFSTILVAFGTEVENWIQGETMHLFKPLVVLVWDGVRWLIALSTSMAFVSLIYYFGIPGHRSWRSVVPGATFVTLLWFPATMFFGWYVTHYATYSVVYGPLSAAIALLVWLYILSVIVLLGAELNAQVYPTTQVRTTAMAPESVAKG